MIIYNCQKERTNKRKEVNKMTVQEIKERIEQLQNRLFMLNMIDRWTSEDRNTANEIENEIYQLKLKIA